VSFPISFDDIPYFRNEFRGDLIITHGVIYYFPHTNVALEMKKKGRSQNEFIEDDLVTLPFTALLSLIKEIRTTINQPKIREIGLWKDGDTSWDLQTRLDAYIVEEKKQPPKLVQYEFTLPRPMRFAQSDIKNLSVHRWLKFETQFDSHDFAIGFHRRKILKEALWESGFITNPI
jgi:hypothetical protein